MSLDAEFQDVLTDLMSECGSVAVAIDGVTGSGLSVHGSQSAEFGENGETGIETGTVRVSVAGFPARVNRGATILVDSKPVVVTECIETSGILRIVFRKVREVAGV